MVSHLTYYGKTESNKTPSVSFGKFCLSRDNRYSASVSLLHVITIYFLFPLCDAQFGYKIVVVVEMQYILSGKLSDDSLKAIILSV